MTPSDDADPSARGKTRGGEVSVLALRALLSHYAEQGHDVTPLLDGVVRDAGGRRPLARVNWDDYRLVLSRLRAWGGDEQLVAAGRRLATSPMLAPLHAVARALVDIRHVYAWGMSARISGQLFACVEARREVRGRGHERHRFRVHDDYEGCQEHWLVCQGALEATPSVLGLPRADVVPHIGQQSAAFDVHYVERGRLLSHILRAARAPLEFGRLTRTLRETLEESFAIQQRAARDRGESRDALASHEHTFEAIFDSAPCMMAISAAADRRLLRVNALFEEFTGFAREELLGRPVDEFGFWPPGERERLLQKLAADGRVLGEPFDFRDRAGRPRGGLVSATTIVYQSTTALLFQAVDVTEAQQLATERRERERLELVQAQAEKLTVLAGGVAHDANNLLTSVAGNTELVLHSLPADSPHVAPLEAALDAATSIGDLTQQLLVYAGRGTPQRRRVDLKELAAQAAEAARANLPPDVQVEVRVPDGPVPIEGDVSQLRQVLLNLLINGGQACAGTSEKRVTLGVRREQDCIRVHVKDTGAGIEGRHLARIFEPFFTTKETGRGLGLAAAQGVARAHGGELDVQSAPGKGSHFQLSLPAPHAPPRPGEP